MLQSDGKREDIDRVYTSKLSPAELEVIFSRTDCCSNGQCMKKILESCRRTSTTAEVTNNLASYYCRQIGVQNNSNSSFHLYVDEIRQPFQEYVFGTACDLEANKQLRSYLVHKFGEGRILSSNNKTVKWKYDLLSISRPSLTVCKIAFIAMTGISNNIIEYSQRKVRTDHVVTDSSSTRGVDKLDSLRDAFEVFGLDYEKYECNINRFVNIDSVTDSPMSFIATTFLAEWFGLAGELEVS